MFLNIMRRWDMLKVVAKLIVKKDRIEDFRRAADNFTGIIPILGEMTEGSEPVEIYQEIGY